MPVVDASVLVAATVDDGPDGAWAARVIEAGNLMAPDLALVEAADVLRRLEQAGRLSRLEATAAHTDLVRLDVDLFPYVPFADRVWELRANVTSYDAWYVAIAELAGLPLATLDRRLARATGPGCEFLLPPVERR